jgi:hypothetical protein
VGQLSFGVPAIRRSSSNGNTGTRLACEHI